jgi:serine/threonine-protein phosphatase 6 regulatory subunit 3
VGNVVAYLDMPQVGDMLLKILLLDREPHNQPSVDVSWKFTSFIVLTDPFIQWFCEHDLMRRLAEALSPQTDVKFHQPALELIKNIILMSSFTPTPGRKEASVLSSNRLSRDLVSPSNSMLLAANLFGNQVAFSPHPSVSPSNLKIDSTTPSESIQANSLSSFMSTASTIMELIRKNNSDYFEQYLFLRAREHLMAVQESFQSQDGQNAEDEEKDSDECREALEASMEDIMAKCGLVNLATLISACCDNLHLLQERLKKPQSSVRFFLDL